MRYVYIRDDDVYEADKTFKKFVEVVGDIPISYAVIPSRISKRCVNFLKGKDVIQHGSIHVKGQDSIRDGYYMMNKMFDKWTKMYAPPWNTVTDLELLILNEMGYVGITSDSDASKRIVEYELNLCSFPITVEIRKEAFMDEHFKDFMKLVDDFIFNNDVIGILMHHKEVANFDNLRIFLDRLSDYSDTTIMNFESALKCDYV